MTRRPLKRRKSRRPNQNQGAARSAQQQSFTELVRMSFSQEEVERHLQSKDLVRSSLQDIVDTGREILEHCPSVAGACASMSAMWTALLRDRLNLPAYCVAGDLLARGQVVFGDKATIADLKATFQRSTPDWDGHCWVVLGDYIADISVFRTAYSDYSPPQLQRVILESFGEGRGLFLSPEREVGDFGLKYVPRFVLPDDQVSALVRGARDFFLSQV